MLTSDEVRWLRRLRLGRCSPSRSSGSSTRSDGPPRNDCRHSLPRRFPNRFDHAELSRASTSGGSRRATSTPSPHRRTAALCDRHSAAQRDRRLAPGARPEQHAAGHPDPHEADAGLQRPVDARHRSRRHRHAGGGRTAAEGGRGQDAARPGPRASWSSGSGPGRTQYEARILGQLKQMGCSCDWQRTALHAGRSSAPARSAVRSSTCFASTGSTAASGWSTGTRSCKPRSATTRCFTRR